MVGAVLSVTNSRLCMCVTSLPRQNVPTTANSVPLAVVGGPGGVARVKGERSEFIVTSWLQELQHQALAVLASVTRWAQAPTLEQ